MIVSGGANIYPAEVEGALEAHPNVQSCVVIGLPDNDLGQSVHAIMETEHGDIAPTENELREFLLEFLTPYKIPRTFEFTQERLRDFDGKTRRSKLREERMTT
ncbi:hypothetical protein ACFO5Q_15190 [Kordiimonas lipolytica]|uniref:AMP-binding enzyme C-terminal domain-containing protein n=1 Tax=Kordiimonas lipolytica TaxID=1662421 RepID=A0ABV8UEB9_9PROT|nr:hypothetical protein [Kordiimonas lipolytica]